MKNLHSSWYHFAAQGSAAVALAFPLIGVPILAASVLLYKHTKRDEDQERVKAIKVNREKFAKNFRARQHYDSYEHYLGSNVWRNKRNAVLNRSEGCCETFGCNLVATEVHHKWYPRVWGNEELESLVAICRQHHEAEHAHAKSS